MNQVKLSLNSALYDPLISAENKQSCFLHIELEMSVLTGMLLFM